MKQRDKGKTLIDSRFIFLLFLSVWFINVPTSDLVAQEKSQPATAQDSVEVIKPVATADIPTEAQQLTLRLREMDKKFIGQTLNDEIDSTFALLAQDIDSLYEVFIEEDLNALSMRTLNNLTNEWTALGDQLDDTEKRLKDQAKEIEAVLATLTTYREIWDKTQEKAKEEKLTRSPVYPVILESIKAIDDERNQISKIRARNLKQQSLVLDKELHITESTDKLSEQIEASQKQLLVRNEPPLSTVLFGSDSSKRDTLNIRADFQRSWEANGELILEYSDENQNSHFITLLVMLVMALLGFLLRNRSKKWMTDHEEEMRPAMKVIDRPIAVSIVFTLIFIARYIYENEPLAFTNLIATFIIFPTFFIFPSLIAKRYHLLCYALLILFIMVRIYNFIIEDSLSGRLFLLFITALGLALVVWFFIIQFRVPWYARKRFLGATLALVFGILFLVSFICNIAGFTTLAELLTTGSLNSMDAAIVFYTVVQVLRGIIKMISLSKWFLTWKSFADNYDVVLKFTFGFINLFFFLWWLRYSLNQFTIYNIFYEGLDQLIFTKRTVGTIEISIANVLGFFLTIWVSLYLSKIIRTLLQNDILSKMKLPRGVPGAISIITRYSILTLGILLAFGVLGIELSQLTFLVGALGVGIGFGLQNIFNNLVSGLILAFERPVQVGDTIQLGELFGSVKEIGIRSSVVRAFTGAEVIVPNGNLISNEVINWTLSDKKRRIELDVGVEYGSNPHVVIAILEKVANDHPEVLKDPAPQAVFINFGDSSLDFKLYYWLMNLDALFTIKSQMYLGVYDSLNEANITIPFPQRDLHVKSIEGQLSDEYIKTNGLKVVEEKNTKEEPADKTPELAAQAQAKNPRPKKTKGHSDEPQLPAEGMDQMNDPD